MEKNIIQKEKKYLKVYIIMEIDGMDMEKYTKIMKKYTGGGTEKTMVKNWIYSFWKL